VQQGIPLHECFDDDLQYLNRVTFRNDLLILARTVGVVLQKGGR
jgi:lipopolysaccharide/colanic/teichoic acid biosynthesis glycosyltransferase